MSNNLRTHRIRVVAGGIGDLHMPGNYVRAVTLPEAGARVQVTTDRGDQVELKQGWASEFPDRFTRLEIKNLGSTDQDVELVVGFGRHEVGEISGIVRVEPNSSMVTYPDVAVADGTTEEVLPANANRAAAIVQIVDASAASLARLGDADVSATRGRQMQQGVEYTVTHEGAVHVHAPAGGGIVTVAVSEELK